MEIYSTEEQQEEAIKKFIKENGMQVVFGAVLGLAGFSGWNWYVDSKISAQEAASADFENYLEVTSAETVKADVVDKELNEFVAAHGETGYAIFANLIAAKKFVENNELAKAEEMLQAASKATTEPSLSALVKTRLARVQIAQEKFDVALATLNTIKQEAFVARVEEIKGDAYMAQGQQDQARQAYQVAADKGGLDGNNVLKMKLQDLAQSINTAS